MQGLAAAPSTPLALWLQAVQLQGFRGLPATPGTPAMRHPCGIGSPTETPPGPRGVRGCLLVFVLVFLVWFFWWGIAAWVVLHCAALVLRCVAWCCFVLLCVA